MIPGRFFLAKQHIALFYWWPPPWLVLEHRQELQPPNTSNLVIVFQFKLLWLFNATFCWIPWSEYQNIRISIFTCSEIVQQPYASQEFLNGFPPRSSVIFVVHQLSPQARPLSEAASPSVALKGRYLTAPALVLGMGWPSWPPLASTGHENAGEMVITVTYCNHYVLGYPLVN